MLLIQVRWRRLSTNALQKSTRRHVGVCQPWGRRILSRSDRWRLKLTLILVTPVALGQGGVATLLYSMLSNNTKEVLESNFYWASHVLFLYFDQYNHRPKIPGCMVKLILWEIEQNVWCHRQRQGRFIIKPLQSLIRVLDPWFMIVNVGMDWNIGNEIKVINVDAVKQT